MGEQERSTRPQVASGLELASEDSARVSRRDPKGPRLVGIPSFSKIDLGEQIVGSRHRFPISAPLNIAPESGDYTTTVTVDGAREFGPEVQRSSEVGPPNVTYAPTARGRHHTRVSFTALWKDNRRETLFADVHASARGLQDVPGDGATQQSSPSQRVPERPGTDAQSAKRPHQQEPYSAAASDVLDRAEKQLNAFAGGLYGKQAEGINVAEKEAGKYKAPKVEPSVWWDIAKLALTIGTGGVAGALEELVAERVSKLISKGAERAIERVAAHAEESFAGTVIAKGVSNGFEHAMEERMKNLGEEKEVDRDQDAPPESTRVSEDASINFFSSQRTALIDAQTAMSVAQAGAVYDLKPLLASHPDAALATVEAVSSALRERGAHVAEIQANATSLQWVAFRARMELGSEEVASGKGKQHATKLDGVREFKNLTPPSSPAGLLRINVTLDGDKIHVHDARLDGQSSLIAARVLKTGDLKTARIPLRISIGNELGFITTDELGRVRYSGFHHLDPDNHSGMDEAQEIRGAQRIVDLVLAKPLAAWGVTRVSTDDGGE